MEIIIGKNAGFCFGVERAVNGAKEQVKKEKKIYCLGELVHNAQVIEALEKDGMVTIENLEEIQDESAKVMFRSHGVAKEIYEQAEKRKISYEDLTCPKVLYLHKLAEKYTKDGFFVLLVGSKTHAENIGTISFCKKENCYQFEGIEELQDAMSAYAKSGLSKLVLLSQTTYSLAKFESLVEELKKKCPEVVVENTICASTRIRQEETKELARKVDKMIIIGGKNSSNTKKLYEVAKKECEKTYLVETEKELNREAFVNEDKVGIMAGASTPKESIQNIKKFLEKEGENS